MGEAVVKTGYLAGAKSGVDARKSLNTGGLRAISCHRVKASISNTFNILQVAGDCQRTPNDLEDQYIAGDFAGDGIRVRPN